jgi:hypothetical protein
MTQHKPKLAVLLILTLLLMFSGAAFADGTDPGPSSNNTTTYLIQMGGYWVAVTYVDYLYWQYYLYLCSLMPFCTM